MNFLKNGFFLLTAFTIISLASCSKDDDCTAPAIDVNIIGTWDAVLGSGEVEFKTDGTYVDDDEALFGVEVNGVVYDQRTYAISGDTLTLTVANPNGSGESSVEYEVSQNECDEIKLEVDAFGIVITETLKRK
jgi:archaellum component FlaF (FlaF/FlaG flagellin family)